MAVLLTVLKITGIILLSILGLVLLILLIVLFAPIGYESTGVYDDDDKPLINVYAHWLLRIIRFRFTLKNREKDHELKVLFFRLLPKEEKSGPSEEKAEKTDTESVPDENSEDEAPEEPDENTEPETADEVFEKFEEKISEDEKPEKEHVSVFKKISDAFIKIKRKTSDIYDRIKDGRLKAEDLVRKLSDERTKNAVIELWLVLKKLLWHIRPRRFRLYLHYGMADPSHTGEVFGIYNSLYPIHMGKPVIVPDFDKKCLDGNYSIRGHIQLFFVLTALIRLYFNKDVKRLYAIIKK